jgi:ACS family hexuronate transporter-like MFS transporter
VGRKVAMWISSLAVVPMIFAYQVTGLWTTVLLLGIATAGHQGFSSNLYTLVSDMFPKRATASVSGLGGMFGYLSAAAFQPFVGYFVETRHNYIIPFACAGSAYVLANIVIQILVPRLQPANLGEDGSAAGPVAVPQ